MKVIRLIEAVECRRPFPYQEYGLIMFTQAYCIYTTDVSNLQNTIPKTYLVTCNFKFYSIKTAI